MFQAATGPPKYNGPVHVVKSLWSEGGIKSLYKGTLATLLRDVPASAAYFGGYEILQRALTPEGKDRRQVTGTWVVDLMLNMFLPFARCNKKLKSIKVNEPFCIFKSV